MLEIKLTADELAKFVLEDADLKAAVIAAYVKANAPTLAVIDLKEEAEAEVAQ